MVKTERNLRPNANADVEYIEDTHIRNQSNRIST